jgi:EmrB/QacA subfamily drug resistance transporter
LGVVLVVADNTIVNVALPTISRELDADTGGLQWLVDAYLLVFAGMLLPFGALGDRFGRRWTMVVGLVVLGAASATASWADSLASLIACRVVMGLGAALVFPATLSLVTGMFADARQRRIAVAIWSATVGVGVILGPLLGGYLLERAWWGSVFLINVPVAAAAIVGALALVPESREGTSVRFDPVGAALSFATITALVFAIIEAPTRGWLDPVTGGAVVSSVALAAVFVAWERRHPAPVVPLELLARPTFFGPVVVLTLATLTLFGFVFVATQYLQVVLGLGTFASGLRYLPFAVAMIVTAVKSPMLVGALGAARVVSAGMVALAVAMLATLGLGARPGGATSALVLALVTVLGIGMGLVTAPATELLMHAVPPGRAGIGSGMNDAARQVGGAFGVAVMGATFSASYGSTLRGSTTLAGLDDSMMERLVHSPGMALVAGAAGPPELVEAVQEAFVTGMHRAALVGAVAALLGSAATWRLLR